jgi:hypothetical protein
MGDRILLTIPKPVQFGAGRAGVRMMAAMIDEHLLARLDRSDRVWLAQHLRSSKLPVAPGKALQPLTWPYAEFGEGGHDSNLLASLIRARRASYEAACATAESNQQTIDRWLDERGSPRLREQVKVCLAGNDEVAAERAAGMLPAFPEFGRIADSELAHKPGCRGLSVRMVANRLPGEVDDVLGTAWHQFTPKQIDYAHALACALAELPSTETYLRSHKASCPGCGAQLVRFGLMAKVIWAGTTVRREYALPQGDPS